MLVGESLQIDLSTGIIPTCDDDASDLNFQQLFHVAFLVEGQEKELY